MSRRTTPRAELRRAPLATLLVLALLCGACFTGRTVPTSKVIDTCREIRNRGVFNDETMACFPQVAAAVEERLCAARFADHYQANAAGFGYGYRVYGDVLMPLGRMLERFDRMAVATWQVEHCRDAGAPPRGGPAWSMEGGVRWDDLWERLPESLVGPWRNCEPPRWDAEPPWWPMRCYLLGSFDTDAADGEIRFAAWTMPDHYFDFGARLRADLEVEGADCGGREWRAGSRISSYSARVLDCRRRGRSAVRVRLVTGEGSCERRLPELTAPPWRELCAPARSVAGLIR